MILIIGVRFRKSGKVYYFAPNGLDIKKGDHVIVETARGIEYGLVVLGQKEVTDDKVVQPLKDVISPAFRQIHPACQMLLLLLPEADWPQYPFHKYHK